MDVRQIRDFVAVVRCSSFAAASRNLRISQPGLGYQVKQLEQELRVQLLERHARGVSLTSAGERFLDHAELILTVINDAKMAMAEFANDDRQDLVIGLSPTPGQVLAPILLGAHAKHDLKVRLREGFFAELHESVMRGTLDLAICLNPASTPLKTIRMYSEPLYLIGPSNGLNNDEEEVTMRELEGLPLILSPQKHTPRRLLESAAARHGIKLTVGQELEAISLRHSLIVHNGHHTVATYSMFAEEIVRGILRARRIVDPQVIQTVYAVYCSSMSPALEKKVISLVDYLVASTSAMQFSPVQLGIAAE
jgi:LysR family nitrogen assimilation transcriptional regulator